MCRMTCTASINWAPCHLFKVKVTMPHRVVLHFASSFQVKAKVSITRGRGTFDPDAAAINLDLFLDDRQANSACLYIVPVRQCLKYGKNALAGLRVRCQAIVADTEFRHACVKARRD